MSSKNGSTRARIPARLVRPPDLRQIARARWRARTGGLARSAASAGSASSMAWFRRCAPWLPPKTRTVNRSRTEAQPRPRRRASPARISARTGLPVTCVRRAGKKRAVSANETATALAIRPSARLARPGMAFCSWITRGMRAGGRRPARSGPRRIRRRRTPPAAETPAGTASAWRIVPGSPSAAARFGPASPFPLTWVAVEPAEGVPPTGQESSPRPRAPRRRRGRSPRAAARAGHRAPPGPGTDGRPSRPR